MYKAIIFDMDGVIVDNHQYHVDAWREFCAIKGIPFTEEAFRAKYFGKSNFDIFSSLMSKPITLAESDVLGEEKEVLYRRIYSPFIKPVEGLIDFLSCLKERGLKLAIGTSSGPSNLNFVVNTLSIGHYFDAMVDSSAVERAKPHPDIYLKAAQALGIAPAECLVFEDSISGIAAAHAAGMRAAALLTTHRQDELPQVELYVKNFLSPELYTYLGLK